MFEQLMGFQTRILAILNRVEKILMDPTNRDVATLSHARWEMTRTLREYQLFKHSRIFNPLLAQPDHRARKAQRMKAECIRVGDEFHRYVLKWSVMSILDHWAEYHPSALGTLTLLRTHLAKERIGVAELLDIKIAA